MGFVRVDEQDLILASGEGPFLDVFRLEDFAENKLTGEIKLYC